MGQKILRGLQTYPYSIIIPSTFMAVVSMLLELQCDRSGPYEIDSHLKAQWMVPGKLHTSLHLSTER